MTQQEVNTLTLTTYYVMQSTKTGKVYIDEENTAYLYEIQKDAKVHMEKDESLCVSDRPESIRALVLCTEIYEQGGDRIFVKRANKQEVIIELTGDHKSGEIRHQYYNHELNASLNKLKQTQKKKYLREFKNESFILPIKLDPRQPKQQQRIHYAFTKLEDKEELFFAFSTLKDFNEWNKKQGEQFAPYEMRIELFVLKHEGKGFILNPETDNLVIMPQFTGIIKEEKKK